jgi:hypothetical protein
MSGAIPPLPQYAFIACCSAKSTGKNLPLVSYVVFNYDIGEVLSTSLCAFVFQFCFGSENSHSRTPASLASDLSC